MEQFLKTLSKSFFRGVVVSKKKGKKSSRAKRNGKQFLIAEAIIRNPLGKILLMKRSPRNRYFINLFELPGGCMEFGEDPEQAIKREIKEECGLSVSKCKLLRVDSYFDERNNLREQGIVFVYKCKAKGKVSLSRDHLEFIWVYPREAKKKKLTPATRKTLFG